MMRFSGRCASVVSLVLAAGLLGTAPAPADPPGPGEPGFIPGPTYAGNTWKWGDPAARYEWEPDTPQVIPMQSWWRVRGPAQVVQKGGMMNFFSAAGGSGNTVATLKRKARKVGRWEMRLRTRRFEERTFGNYRVVAALVPAGKKRCGGRDIIMHSSRIGSNDATFEIHNLPKRSFVASRRLDLSDNQWHTYAVEVTRKRISWFVDSQVVVSERRKAALSGAKLTVQFRMIGVPGQRMNRSRLSMDWLRVWNLKRKNQKSVQAPQARATTNPAAC